MTIDEAIRYLNNHSSLDNRNSEDREAVQKLIDTVIWYHSQDLIKSEDAIETLSQMQWYDADGYSVEDYADKKEYAETWVAQIPKAEPPKSVEWWNRSPSHDKFDYNEPLKTESMVLAERLIKDAGESQ